MIYADKKPDQNKEKDSSTIKLCFLGDKQVGKSSLISKIKGNAKASELKPSGKQVIIEDSLQSSKSPDVVT